MNMYAKIAIASLAVAVSAPALAQSSASATANGTTTIMAPISIAKVKDMNFGKVIKPSNTTPTVYSLDATTGTRSVAGGDGVLLGGTAGSQAQFTVTGEGAAAITVTVPAAFTMSGTGAPTITTSGTPPTVISGAAGATGTATVNVGAAMSLTSASATGSFSGTLQVTAAYN
jgi:hypothetical protein